MNIMNRYIKLTFTGTIIAILLVSGVGCGNSTYSTFNIHEGMQPLSFEYPQQYKLVRLDMENDDTSQYTTIGLATGGLGNYSEIYVYIWNTTADLPGAAQIMKKLLDNASQTLIGFKLGETTTVTIAGLTGEYSIFSASSDSTNTQQPPSFYRVSCCTSGTKAIEVDMTCDEAIKAATQADYDHLLESFQLLS